MPIAALNLYLALASSMGIDVEECLCPKSIEEIQTMKSEESKEGDTGSWTRSENPNQPLRIYNGFKSCKETPTFVKRWTSPMQPAHSRGARPLHDACAIRPSARGVHLSASLLRRPGSS